MLIKFMKLINRFFRTKTSDKILIFGLGNPGSKYRLSRHNIGQMILDSLADHDAVKYIYHKKLKAFLAETTLKGKEVILAKSEGFMNVSGEPVRLIKNYYKIKTENIWIIHDDVDIAFGKIKISQERGAAGHHGIESIIKHLNSNEFNRIRVGIWNKPFEEKNKNITQSYVIKQFNKEEQEQLDEIKRDAASVLETASDV